MLKSEPSRILQPEDVAATILHALTLPDRALVSELDIRPTNPCKFAPEGRMLTSRSSLGASCPAASARSMQPRALRLISRCLRPGSTAAGPAGHGWPCRLVRETGCGGQCGLCRPYLSRMLRTGETEFHEILTAEDT